MAVTPIERDAVLHAIEGWPVEDQVALARAIFETRLDWSGREYRWESIWLDLGRPVWDRIERTRAAIRRAGCAVA